jgi:hypothetical protein
MVVFIPQAPDLTTGVSNLAQLELAKRNADLRRQDALKTRDLQKSQLALREEELAFRRGGRKREIAKEMRGQEREFLDIVAQGLETDAEANRPLLRRSIIDFKRRFPQSTIEEDDVFLSPQQFRIKTGLAAPRGEIAKPRAQDFTPESLEEFARTNDLSVLEPIEKAEKPLTLSQSNVNLLERANEVGIEALQDIEKARVQKLLSSGKFRLEVGRDGGVTFSQGDGATGLPVSVQSRSIRTIDDSKGTLAIIDQFRDVLRPENVGLLGDLRGLVFGAGQQANVFTQVLSGQAQEIVGQIRDTEGNNVKTSNFFDPNLSKSKLLGNVLAYRLALANNPDGRISEADFRNAARSLGVEKLLSGSGEISAKLDALEEIVNTNVRIAEERLGIPEAEEEPQITDQDLSQLSNEELQALISRGR